MNYWQIGCGSFGREYADEFIRYGMAFVGGDANVATMDKVELGDRVIMKRGMTRAVAAGEVVERRGKWKGLDDKEWLRDFDGWDLRAYCFVDWHVLDEPESVKGLTRGTIQNVHQPDLRRQADRWIATLPTRQLLDQEPGSTQSVEDKEILKLLIREGLRPGAAEDLTATLNRVRLLAQYYYYEAYWEDIREHETRTFLIIPLLLALGWAEQQIKIEYPVKLRKRADVVCFSRPYSRNNQDCVLVLESKGFSQGLFYAADQAADYAAEFPNCRVIVASNGYCYKAFIRGEDDSFPQKPSAYVNLLRPRDKYPLDPEHVDGCLQALKVLLPSYST